MSTKVNIGTLKENLLAVIVAFILAISIVFVISKVDFLKADITGYKADNQIPKNVDFITYKTSSGFKIVANKKFDGLQSVIVDLIYDPKKVKISDDNIQPDNVSISFIDTGQVEIQVNSPNSYYKGDVILNIKNINGNYINLDSIQLIFTDGTVSDSFNIATVNK